ncbi:penicillin-binding protein [Aureimonas sp. SA4125]|uniref:PBP1A family penicillin-binding protein n=1 Tax=Aureimonas sp. SA4125 TaxID=2826993 RepID=UPI001CC65D87|nr:transglycosylase domain-containing protein [Aureimonas sp. SA4125]BDA86943.1 penicillin-binding protein [Aureimonas sp. SA4125]
MAGRRKGERIEPSFQAKRGADDLRLSADDRAVAADVEPARQRPSKVAREKAAASEKLSRRRGFFGRGGGGGGGGGDESGRPRRRRSFVGHIFRLAFFTGLWGTAAVACVVAFFAIKLPQEAWAVPDRPPNVKIVSVTGDLLANRGLTGGEAVSLDEMSPNIPKAVIAIEDRRFYSHYGVDPLGIIRAFSENMAAGATVQGGSTLTQQLAKNIFLNPDQTLQRKIQEAILSVWLEQKFSKDQILEMYLNRVYFGSGATGVEAAARRYFNKSAKDVTLSEAALLAGLLKAPSRLSPVRDPAAAKARAAVVLQAMLEEKMIDRADFDAAIAEQPTKQRAYWNGAENYAADIVMRDLKTLVGDVHADVVVETTIDLGLEREAEAAIRDTIANAKQNVSQGALVSLDGTGAIRALVGGKDYAESQFNRAVDAKRQPGSAFKPFVYETALEYGWRPETGVDDGPTQIGNWSPMNYDRKYRGPVTVAYALAHSLNTIAAQLTEKVTAKAVIDTALRMGISSPLVDNPSIALGTSEVTLLELTGAFAPFANGGYQAVPHLVNRVTDTDGKVLYERGAEVPPIIVTDDTVAMMNAMLKGTVTSGTGRKAALKGWESAGKTGTTQDFKDAWFMGYTANLTTGVWFGNDNGAPMKKVTGGGLPAEAWHQFMTAAHEGLPAMPLPGNYTIGGEHEPLTASNGGMAPGDPGGFYDSELPPPSADEISPASDGGAPASADPFADIIAAPAPDAPVSEEVLPRRARPDRSESRQAERPTRRERERERAAREEMPRRNVEADRGYADPRDEEEDVYGMAPLPPERDIYGSGDLPPADYYYDDDGAMRAPEEIAPVRGPSRIVRGTPPPGAILEGRVEDVGRASDRSLFRGLFGG